MSSYRIFVEKKPEFRVEAKSMREELNENLSLNLKNLRLLNAYDLFGFTRDLLERSRYSVFGETVTDNVSDSLDLEGQKYIAVEYLPGQFDQRAASAVDCVHLIEPSAKISIKSSRIFIFDADISDKDLERIKRYVINAVEAREKDLGKLSDTEHAPVKPVPVLDGFCEMNRADLTAYRKKMGLAMNEDDLEEVIKYFKEEGREPNETELRILDTYWSDHCRHTTFTTELTEIGVEESFIKGDIEGALELYVKMRKGLGRENKPLCLMDLATIGAKWLRKEGKLDDMEVSEENNACSIYIDVDNAGKTERWLLMFKNETHNHPTEIEPFGGAATCLGGAIRDPLSGRSYVYQAMRVTGAGDIWKPVSETLEGKLPQKVISRKAAQGYSSYGNQIGLATTHVHEILDEGYVAKRMEVGAVVGAVKASNVRRESPVPGDVILMLGGRTGRDGIGGATGSSKEHTGESLETCGSEVQKGNAPEERKLQHLFRRPEVTRLIKKSNDFGAGGVSVAIGELADGLDIYLDRVPVKYTGLNSTELAISESQERMAVVIEAKDEEEFRKYCAEENIEATHVADVTGTARMMMYNHGEKVVDLRRDFIDSAGARHFAKAEVEAPADIDPFAFKDEGKSEKELIMETMSRPQVLSQKGLVEMFDSTIGRSTVLMPYGGMTQLTEAQVSVQKLPTDGFTDTASVMAYGFDPRISRWSPYHGAAYSVVHALAKIVSCGGDWSKVRFSFQEYFQRMTEDPKGWGRPLSALLGALKMQDAFGLPAIGGKDSMSGTFEETGVKIEVPPTLVAFGVVPLKASRVISPEFKLDGDHIYLIRHTPLPDRMPDVEQLKRNWDFIHGQIAEGNILSAWATGIDGAIEALVKMSFGNLFVPDVHADKDILYAGAPGSVLVESVKPLEYENAIELGMLRIPEDEAMTIRVNRTRCGLHDLRRANFDKFAEVYPYESKPDMVRILPKGMDKPQPAKTKSEDLRYKGEAKEHPAVYIPVFPGTNCDYDTAKAFRAAGAVTKSTVFRNLTEQDVYSSISQMRDCIDSSDILALVGGFSAGDEPDGSGKFIANVLNNKDIADAIEGLISRGGLILGICNGFQALVKSGLLPYGHLGMVTEAAPTLFRNDVNRHVSTMVKTRVSTDKSPWLRHMAIGTTYTIPVSHGEGKFVVRDELARELFDKGQVAFQYVDYVTEQPTMASPSNPNGSYYAIEGIISEDGHILGKMGHSERYEQGLFKNIPEDMEQPLFENAVKYFRGK